MRQPFMPTLKNQLGKILGLSSPSEEARSHKFKQLTKGDWFESPDRFCREEKRIHPKLIGRFYGENNIKKCALEIRRIEEKIAFRYAWQTRSRHTWADKSQEEGSNKYHSLIIKGSKIGTRNGLIFRRGPDGRYYLGYKRFMEIIMKKV